MTYTPKPHGAVPPAPPLEATLDQWKEARKACANRARERGEHELALSFEQGGQDHGWAMRHEIKNII